MIDNIVRVGNNISIDINKCKFYEYNPKLNCNFSIENLVKTLINQDYYIKFNLSKKLFGNYNSNDSNINGEPYSNLFKYLFHDKENKLLLSSIYSLNYSLAFDELVCYDINNIDFELDIIEKGFEDKNFISYLSDKYKDDPEKKLKILQVLFKNYNFPLTFNKKRLNSNFELIMYFSFLNIDMLVKIVDS